MRRRPHRGAWLLLLRKAWLLRLLLLLDQVLEQRLALGQVLSQQLVLLQYTQVLNLLCREAGARGGYGRLRRHALDACARARGSRRRGVRIRVCS